MSSAMDKTLFDMKFTAKQLLKESAKCEKKHAEEVRCRLCVCETVGVVGWHVL